MPEHQQKGREATKRSLGVEYPFQSKEIHDSIKQNNLKTYGNEVYLASETGKAQMLKKYGSEYYVSSEALRERMMKEYGSEYYINSDACKKKMMEEYGSEYYTMSETCKKKMMEEYGSEYFINSSAFKDKMMATYGVQNAMQSPELLSKALYTMFSTKKYQMPSGNIVIIQGYENFALDDLLESGIAEEDIVVGCKNVPRIKYMYQDKEHVYYPDIYVKSENLLIEVKSMYTYHRDRDKNICKFQKSSKEYNFELWVYDGKGNRIIKQPFVQTELIFHSKHT